MAKPDNAKSGCFSNFFHLLFCAENGNSPPLVPLHPSDHITESYVTELVHPNKDSNTIVNEAKPGVVARLMGLDSLPNTNLVSKGSAPDLVPRSRSVNFLDYLLKFDVSQDNHHKMKTSASFREVPASFQKKNHDVLVLYWGSGSEDHKVGSNLRKQEMGLGELRQRKKQGSKNKEIVRERSIVTKERNHGKNKRISKFKNEPIMVPVKHSSKVRNQNEAKVLASVSASSKNCSYKKSSTGSRSRSTLPNKQKKVLSEPKQKKIMRKQQSPKKTETSYSSENFSPISVLDNNDYQFLYGPDFLDYTSPLVSKSKWEFSELLFLGDSVEERGSKNKGYVYPDINREKECLSELMLKLRTLIENDMREFDCTQKCMSETEILEEICLVCEHKIFDILLHEVVNELVELSY